MDVDRRHCTFGITFGEQCDGTFSLCPVCRDIMFAALSENTPLPSGGRRGYCSNDLTHHRVGGTVFGSPSGCNSRHVSPLIRVFLELHAAAAGIEFRCGRLQLSDSPSLQVHPSLSPSPRWTLIVWVTVVFRY
ncbi:hypothetical protein DPEC_G00299950 [Dallia pectoralis]|uniref:Uncharacterized protein n=1 Tax=Dallia pectoralis TaxID=75939 RepID=A0ACC2FGD1_DALPE|nr:hypothetical protein DPEC_G00299950 [Dallia pectoralis]